MKSQKENLQMQNSPRCRQAVKSLELWNGRVGSLVGTPQERKRSLQQIRSEATKYFDIMERDDRNAFLVVEDKKKELGRRIELELGIISKVLNKANPNWLEIQQQELMKIEDSPEYEQAVKNLAHWNKRLKEFEGTPKEKKLEFLEIQREETEYFSNLEKAHSRAIWALEPEKKLLESDLKLEIDLIDTGLSKRDLVIR